MAFPDEAFWYCVTNNNQAVTLGRSGKRYWTNRCSCLTFLSTLLPSFPRCPRQKRGKRLYHWLAGMLICTNYICTSARMAGGPGWREQWSWLPHRPGLPFPLYPFPFFFYLFLFSYCELHYWPASIFSPLQEQTNHRQSDQWRNIQSLSITFTLLLQHEADR